MLKMKELLTKLLNAISVIINTNTVDVISSSSVTITAGSTYWFSVSYPTSWKNIQCVGYYVEGNGNTVMNVYCCRQTNTGATMAVRNSGASSYTVKANFYFRHI